MSNSYSVDVEYDVFISKIRRWGEIIRFGGKINLKDIIESVKNINVLIDENRDDLIRKVFGKKIIKNIKHHEAEAVDICILALVVGTDLGIKEEVLITLGAAALLKDIGMNRVPEEIMNKVGNLTDEEFAIIRNHPYYSIDILNEHGIDSGLQDIIIDHHEQWDGMGYPKGKRGENISYLARVISVVDGFNAIKEDRPYRKSLHGYDAIKAIIGDNGHRYDPSILEVVLKSIGIYPIGSYVALNDASICQVVSTNKDYPLKPVVKVIINKNGTESKSNVVIDLADNPRYFIVKNVPVS